MSFLSNHFPTTIPVKLEVLLANRDTSIVDKIFVFDKVLVFFLSPWHGLERFWSQSLTFRQSFFANFPTVGLRLSLSAPSVDNLLNVGFGWSWYFRKVHDACFCYEFMELESGSANYNFGNRSTRNSFLNDEPFSNRDYNQIKDAPRELRQPSCRQNFLVQERCFFLDHPNMNCEEYVCEYHLEQALFCPKY